MYWTTGILGLAFAVAPFIFGYSDNPVAMWTSVILGGAAMVISLIEGATEGKDRWEYWTAALIGLVAVVAPFVLGFGQVAEAMWTSVAVGILIALSAGGKLFYDKRSFL